MNEDEKKAIDMLEKYITEHKFYNIKQSDGLENNIKILLDLYKQEKEWTQKIIKTEKFYRELYNDVVKKTNERYIPKDEIREKIKELEDECDNSNAYDTTWYEASINTLKELLEE